MAWDVWHWQPDARDRPTSREALTARRGALRESMKTWIRSRFAEVEAGGVPAIERASPSFYDEEWWFPPARRGNR